MNATHTQKNAKNVPDCKALINLATQRDMRFSFKNMRVLSSDIHS